jgi:hypothetical protein
MEKSDHDREAHAQETLSAEELEEVAGGVRIEFRSGISID